MPFEKGNQAGAMTRFRLGMTANPGGRPYNPLTRRERADAIREILAVAEQVLTDPKMLEVWRLNLRQKWVEDPWHVLRALLPFMPRETLTLSREIGGTLQQMTVSQLRQIVATLPEGEQGEVDAIEVDSADDDAASGQAGDGEAPSEVGQAAIPPPAEAVAIPAENTPSGCAIPTKTVTKTVTKPPNEDAENAKTLENIEYYGELPADCISDDEELRLV